MNRLPAHAAAPLIAAGCWTERPAIDIAQLCGLLTKTELAEGFPLLPRSARRPSSSTSARRIRRRGTHAAGWHIDDQLLRLSIAPLCDRLRADVLR